jgi:hypothetical protein
MNEDDDDYLERAREFHNYLASRNGSDAIIQDFESFATPKFLYG